MPRTRSVTPWLVELARTLPGLVRSYVPGGPIDARTRERVILAVTDVDGCRWCAWVHGAWAEYLGDGVDEPAEAEAALLAYARACAEAGHPVGSASLDAHLPPGAVEAVRATVAQVGVAGVVGRRAESLAARLVLRRAPNPIAMAGEAATVALALPVAAPIVLTAAAMRLATKLAPAVPEVEADEDANLLVHLLARTVPAYLANAGVRLAALRIPVPISFGVRAGRSTATVRIGRRRIEIAEGIAPDAVLVVEGDVEPLLQVATGSMLRELAALRVRRD